MAVDLLSVILQTLNFTVVSAATATRWAVATGVLAKLTALVASSSLAWVLPAVGIVLAGVVLGGTCYYLLRRSPENDDQVVNPTDDSTDETIYNPLQSIPEDERNKAGAKILSKLVADEEVKQVIVKQMKTDGAFISHLRDIVYRLDE